MNPLGKKPHIFVVSSWYPTNHSSAGTFTEELILALSSRGIKTSVLISEELTLGNYIRRRLKGEPLLSYRKNGAILAIENLTTHFFPLRWERDPRTRRLRNILNNSRKVFDRYVAKQGKPDIIFHQGIFDYTYITRFLSEFYGIPYWYKEHSSYIENDNFPCANDFETDQNLIDFVKNATRWFAPSEFYADKMSGIFGRRFEVLHNVLGDRHFSEIAGFPVDRFVFLNIAVKSPAKNQKLLVRAFHKAFGKSKEGESLVIAGDGALHDDLVNLVKELGADEKIKILKFQNRAEIDTLLTDCNVFVLASNLETFGVVLIEAMAKGIPVISSKIPGPMEIVHDKNGIFFEPDNEENLILAMKRIKHSYLQYDRAAIQKEMRIRFGPDSIIDVLLDPKIFTSRAKG